jgi:NADH:ubiquinone oxidoreductase subunit 2 (subunit N)
MNKVIVEKEVLVPTEREGTASSAIWALAFIIIVGIIVGALYYSGILRRITNPQPQKINVEVQAPPAQQPAPPPANR